MAAATRRRSARLAANPKAPIQNHIRIPRTVTFTSRSPSPPAADKAAHWRNPEPGSWAADRITIADPAQPQP
jgi:hypothetical protein